MHRPWLAVLALGVILLVGIAPGRAQAAPITAADFDNPTLINFDTITTFTTLSPSTIQPFADLGVRFTGSVAQGVFPAPFTAPSHLTSGFASGLNYVVRADFTVPVNRVGADLFSGFIGDAFFMRIFDDRLSLLEELTGTVTLSMFSISSPAFVGLESSQNIARAEFVAASTSGLTTFPRIDNFRFQAVPEPSGLTLVGLGVAVLLGYAGHCRLRADG